MAKVMGNEEGAAETSLEHVVVGWWDTEIAEAKAAVGMMVAMVTERCILAEQTEQKVVLKAGHTALAELAVEEMMDALEVVKMGQVTRD